MNEPDEGGSNLLFYLNWKQMPFILNGIPCIYFNNLNSTPKHLNLIHLVIFLCYVVFLLSQSQYIYVLLKSTVLHTQKMHSHVQTY